MTYTFELSFFSVIEASEVNNALFNQIIKDQMFHSYFFPRHKLWSPSSLIRQQKIT